MVSLDCVMARACMSHNVEDLSLFVDVVHGYKIPDLFFISSSVKQLCLVLPYFHRTLKCSVSWTSLKKLSLWYCFLPDESIAKILTGCPVLESLTLNYSKQLEVLDLSKSLRLRTLEIRGSGQTQIVAPHIHFLTLRSSQSPLTLVDVSSLTEAKLDTEIQASVMDGLHHLTVSVTKMLKKLENAKRLSFGGNFLLILSLAEVCGVTFPMFKIKALTLETEIFQYVIPGIERLLQNSPDLKMVTVREVCYSLPSRRLEKFLDLQGLNRDQRWNRYPQDLESKHVASFVELVLKITKTLDKMVVLLRDPHRFNFKELVQTLSHNNNVSIVLSTTRVSR